MLGQLHLCLVQHGYLSRWLIEVYRLVRILKLIQSSSTNQMTDWNRNNKKPTNIWQLMIRFPELLRGYACYVLSRLSIFMSFGMEYDIAVALFSFLKTEREFVCPFQPVHSHFVGKESTTLLQKLISEDFEYSPDIITSSHSRNNRPKFINLEQNWDRMIYCWRKWNGEIRDGSAGVLDVAIIRSIFEELLPENMQVFSKRWLYLLFQECIHGEEQTLANIRKLGVATSLERVHHLQSRMNPFTGQKQPLHSYLETSYSCHFRAREKFFMEMILLADSCRWNNCLIQLVHLMIERIIQHLDPLSMFVECEESYREEYIVDCVLYGRLATKILALLLTLTGPHETRKSNHSQQTSKTRKGSYVHKKNSFQRKATSRTTFSIPSVRIELESLQ